jgi:hypothetical protein
MLRRVHDGKTKPITWVGEAGFPKGHIEEVSLMLEKANGDPVRAQGTDTGSLKVDGAAGGSSGPSTSNTAAITRVAASTSGVELLAAGTRKGFKIYNDSDKRITIAFDDAVSGTNFTLKMNPDSFYDDDEPFWQGAVWALWDGPTPSGAAQITELT